MTALLLLGGALLVAPASRRGARLRSLLSVERERGRHEDRWARLRAGVPISDQTLLRLLPVLVVPLLPVIGVLQTAAIGLVLLVLTDLVALTGRRRRARRHLAGWERATEALVAELRIGRRPGDALASAARGLGGAGTDAGSEGAAGVVRALSEAHGVAGLGGDGPAVLERGDDAIAAELAGAWRLAERHGVSLAEVVDRLRADLAERRDRNARVEASLAGPRATSVVLSALPVVGIVMGTGIGAEPLGFLVGSTAGGVVALVGATLLVAGLWWTNRILDGVSR